MSKEKYTVIAPKQFAKKIKKKTLQHPDLKDKLKRGLDILERDAENKSTQHNIKKLINIKPGEGQWRLRIGSYRIRYDILRKQVIPDKHRSP